MNKTINYAVITGASGGIGKELAHACAKAGFSLFLVARDKDGLDVVAKELQTAYGIQCHTLAADLTDPQSVQHTYQAAKRLGNVTHLINNAGFGDYGPFATSDWQRQQAMIQLNISALTQLTRLFLPDMQRAKHGRILQVASIAAFLPGPHMSVYYATKHYVLSFSESLAEELRGSEITVTALCPGPTATKFESTAHLQSSRLFKGRVASAQSVAAFGFAAMQSGKRIAVHGTRNKLQVFFTRLLPRTTLASMYARLQAPISKH